MVQLEVSEDADKSAIEGRAKELYETQLKALEAQYEKQLRLQGEQHVDEIHRLIEFERMEKATLMGVITTMAGNQGPTYQFNNPKFGGGFAAESGIQIGGTFNDLSQTQDSAEATTKIQQLLAQFQDQSGSEDVAQDEAAKALAVHAQQNPTLMGKLVTWGKALGSDASKAATSEAAKVAGGEAAKVVITKALTLLGLSLL